MTDHTNDAEQSLGYIQQQFSREVLEELLQPFVELRRWPSEGVLNAIGAITGSSHNGVRRFIARLAQRSGSDFMSNYLPAE